MLKIGDVTFGLEADTKGLQRSIDKLKEFEKAVNRTARSQADGAQAASKALLAQERAINSALRQTLNLQQALRKAGAPPEQIAKSTNAFRALTNAMSKGKLTTVEYSRAQDKFRASMASSRRVLKDISASHTKAAAAGHKFSEVLRALESSAVLAVGPLSGLGARIQAFTSITSRSTLIIAGFVAAAVGMGVALAKMSAHAVRTRLAMDKIEAGLRAATGSSTGAAREFQYVSDTSKRLGLDLQVTAQGYSKLVAASRGTSLQGQQTRKIFEGVAVAARAMNLSAEDTQGVLKAIEQIMSKGTVQAEELRGQLGDRLVGAFQLAASATGKSTVELNKLLKSGGLLSTDLLPKLADELIAVFGPEAQRQATKLGASIQNLSTASFEWGDAFDRLFGISDSLKGIIDFLTASLDNMTKAMNGMIPVITAMQNKFIDLGISALEGMGYVVDGILKIQGYAPAAVNALKGLRQERDALVKKQANDAMFDSMIANLEAWQDASGIQPVVDSINNLDTNNLDRAASKIGDIVNNLEKLKAQKGAIGRGASRSAVDDIAARFQAKDILSSVPTEQHAQLAKQLSDAGYNANNLEDALTSALIQQRKLSDSVSDYGRELGKTPEKVNKANQQLEEMRLKLTALQSGPATFEKMNAEIEKAKEIIKFKEALDETALSQDAVNEKVREFTALMGELEKAQEEFDKQKQILEEFKQTSDKVFKSFEDNLLSVIDGTKSVSEAFADMVDSILRDITRMFLNQATSSLGIGGGSSSGGFLGDLFGGLFGGGSSGLSSAALSLAKGGAIPGFAGGGSITIPGHGGLDSQPILVKGTPGEQITFSRNGNSSGSNVIVNVYNNGNSKATVTETQQGGTRSIDVIIDEMTAKNISNPSSRTSGALRKQGNTNIRR